MADGSIEISLDPVNGRIPFKGNLFWLILICGITLTKKALEVIFDEVALILRLFIKLTHLIDQ